MKKVIRLNESQLYSIVNSIINENNFIFEDSDEQIYTNIDKSYDYKIENNTWFAKQKTGDEWMDLSTYPKAIAILNQKTGKNVVTDITPSPNPSPNPKPKPPKPEPNPSPNPKPKPPKPEPPKPVKNDTIVSKTTSPIFLNKIAKASSKISSTKPTPVFGAGQPECAQFVHNFDTQLPGITDAWMAHNKDEIGPRIFTVFKGLSPNAVKNIADLWIKIDKSGGPNGTYANAAKQLVLGLIDSKPPKLQLNDVVGIFYPPSKNHEKAFYLGGKNNISGNLPYIQKKNGKYVPGNTLKSGTAWGMNTHVGIVGAIKDGVPIIFHNIHGQVYADPYTNITDGGKIVWVRRPGNAEPMALNKVKVGPGNMTEQRTNSGLKKKA